MPSADDYGIDFTGATDVTAALQSAINAQTPGSTFTFHPNGLYLTGLLGSVWTPSNVIVDGQGAYFFRNVRRSGDTANSSTMDNDIIQFNAPGSTLKNLNVYGFRKDVYTGNKLTTVTGAPTVAGTTVLLDAQNEEVRLPQVGLDHKFAPNYFRNYETPFYFRGVDGLVRFEAILSDNNHVASDCVFSLIDDSDDTVRASSTLTLTGTPTTYTLTFDPIAVLDHRFRVQVRKATATANTITVASITPYGEAGFRWRGMSAPNTITGGNEFSDAISVVSSANVTFDNIWVEGPDGDGFNFTNAGANCTVLNSTVRGAGRQCFTIEYSTGTTISNCNGYEGGRSGVDLEPTAAALSNTGTIVEDCTFRNIRNYCISSGNWAKNLHLTLTNIMSISAGMGAMYGGGRGVSGADGLIINGFTHLETTRTEADRILEGGGITTVGVPPPVVTDTVPPPGSHAEVDFLCWGINVVGDDIQTQLGVYIKNVAKTHASVSYLPDNVHLTNVRVTEPGLDPPYVIEVANASVEATSGSTDVSWDSSGVVWDDTNVTWDQSDTGGGGITEPAFQNTAFQEDAFQLLPALGIDVTQTMPMFSQDAVVFDGYAAPTEQTIPAFEQSATTINGRVITITQNIPAFTTVGNPFAFQDDAYQTDAFETGQTSNSQSLDTNVTIRVRIGALSGIFQPDAFQDDAFELSDSTPVEIPFPTQHAVVANVPHGQNFAPITQRIPAFAQDATGTIQSGITVVQEIPFPTQALTVFETPGGTITQVMPAFTQAGVAGILIAPVGTVTQTIPMFEQSVTVMLVRWDEWPVTPGSEWPVSVDDEWLVRR